MGTTKYTSCNLLLRAQNSKVIPNLIELDIDASQACKSLIKNYVDMSLQAKLYLRVDIMGFMVHSILSDVLNTVWIIATKSKYVES